MRIHIVSPDFVALSDVCRQTPGRRELCPAIRAALEDGGYPAWDKMEIDLFASENGYLVLARPSGVWLPGYALEFLRQKNFHNEFPCS